MKLLLFLIAVLFVIPFIIENVLLPVEKPVVVIEKDRP